MPGKRRPEGVKLEPTHIEDWREFRGKTQTEVGAVLGIHKSAVSRIEAAKTPYDQFQLQQLRDILNVSIPDLLFTDPLRQGMQNELGSVGFDPLPPVRVPLSGNPPRQHLYELVDQVKIPEDIEVLIAVAEKLLRVRDK